MVTNDRLASFESSRSFVAKFDELDDTGVATHLVAGTDTVAIRDTIATAATDDFTPETEPKTSSVSAGTVATVGLDTEVQGSGYCEVEAPSEG